MAVKDPKKLRPEDLEGRPSNLFKKRSDWSTGDEPMTDAQSSYLKTLCEQMNVEFDYTLTKAEAAGVIEELQIQAHDRGLVGVGRRRKYGKEKLDAERQGPLAQDDQSQFYNKPTGQAQREYRAQVRPMKDIIQDIKNREDSAAGGGKSEPEPQG